MAKYVPVLFSLECKEFNTAHLITWLLFGTLYCYISSYPILVFHATRALDFKDVVGNISLRLDNPYLLTLLFTIASYVAAWNDSVLIMFISVSIFSGVQIFRLYAVYSKQKKFGFNKGFEASIAYAYLNKLSKRRGIIEEKTEKKEDEDENATVTGNYKRDLAESYKHLREHGNTAFILMLEMALCPVLFTLLKYQNTHSDSIYIPVIIIVWIIPSVLVHLLGQHLERRFSLFKH